MAHGPQWGHPPSARAAPHAAGRPRTATRVSPAPPATQLQHRRLLPACTSGARFWGVFRRQKLLRYMDQGHFTEERVWLSHPSLLGGTPVAPEESSLGDGDGVRLLVHLPARFLPRPHPGAGRPPSAQADSPRGLGRLQKVCSFLSHAGCPARQARVPLPGIPTCPLPGRQPPGSLLLMLRGRPGVE